MLSEIEEWSNKGEVAANGVSTKRGRILQGGHMKHRWEEFSSMIVSGSARFVRFAPVIFGDLSSMLVRPFFVCSRCQFDMFADA